MKLKLYNLHLETVHTRKNTMLSRHMVNKNFFIYKDLWNNNLPLITHLKPGPRGFLDQVVDQQQGNHCPVSPSGLCAFVFQYG